MIFSKHLRYMTLLLLFTAFAGMASDSLGTIIKVSKLTIKGNTAFSTPELKALQLRLAPSIFTKPKFTISGLHRDTSLLAQFYRSNGFLRVKLKADTGILDTVKKFMGINISINEGLPTLVTVVKIEGVSAIEQSLLLKNTAILPGKPFSMSKILKDLQDMKGIFADSGYLEASVTYEVLLSEDSLHADIHYSIVRGQPIRVSSIEIIGLKDVRPKVVTQRLRLKPQELLTRPKLNDAISNLYATNLFGFVMISYDSIADNGSSKDSSRIIRVRLTEAKFFTATLAAGYQTYEQVRGSLELNYNNFLGYGIRGHALGYANFINQGGELGGTLPWITGIPLDYDSRVSYRHQNEPRIQLAGTFYQWHNGLTYQITNRLRTILTHRLESTNLTIIPPVLPAFIGEPLTHSLGFETSYDSRDDLIDTHRGTYEDGMVEVSGLPGGIGNHFIKLQIDGRIFVPIRTTFVLASAISAGFAIPYSYSAAVPIQERFYLGGSNVMRGYNDKLLGPDSAGIPIGGTLYLAINVAELRFPIFRWIWGDVFLDAGNLWDIRTRKLSDYIAELAKFDLLYNAGFGFRVHLPIAVLSVDMGFKLNKPPSNQNLYALHFKVGHSF